jgi:hypothetical protein
LDHFALGIIAIVDDRVAWRGIGDAAQEQARVEVVASRRGDIFT